MAIALKLRPVNHAKGDRNNFCGPSALSALTGMASGEAARLLRSVTGRASIKGASVSSMLQALNRCGIHTSRFNAYRNTDRPTLAEWFRLTAGQRGGRVFLLVAGNHWQLVSGLRFVCGLTKEVVGLDHPKVRRRSRVAEVFILNAGPAGVRIPPEARKPAVSKAAKAASAKAASQRARTTRLARSWGVTIEAQPRNGHLGGLLYVSHPELEGDEDPWQGDHYAAGWSEALHRVEVYAKHLEDLGGQPVTG